MAIRKRPARRRTKRRARMVDLGIRGWRVPLHSHISYLWNSDEEFAEAVGFLKGNYRFLDLDFSKDPGSLDTTGGSAEGNDAKHVSILGAHVNLPGNFELDAFLRHASALPKPALEGYTTLDARVGWWASKRLEISLWGRNLLDRQHPEFVTTNSLNEQVHRSGAVKLTLRP